MRRSIFVCAHLDAPARELIETTLPAAAVRFIPRDQPGAEDQAALADAEIIFGNLPPRYLPLCPRLKWLQLESVGFEYYNSLAGTSPGFVISNLKGMFEWPAAETALGGLLALGRGLPRLFAAQAEARWIELELRPGTWLLHGQRAIVLGAGSLGRRMRLLLEALECKVQVFARQNPAATLRTKAELVAAVPHCDLLVCCLPKTPETIGLVGRALLEAMPAHGIFVNIGRGAVVDEPALIDVLQRRRIRGAVIDVTAAEPLPPDHALWRCPNTILTQHTGGGYNEELLDKARCFLKNYQRFSRGETVLNVVDLQQGY